MDICIEEAKKKWSDEYVNFDWFIRNIKCQNHCVADLGKICSAEKNTIYQIIKKDL